ncbi:MAG: LamG-like jellyroll fold domain-containing protein, partial [bacterium]|nr:LamG-like jellyroll fold domain-containing protein [bacterium]
MPRTRSFLLTLLIVTSFGLALWPVHADIEEGLVGHWKLDDGVDNPGTTTVLDSVGGHHGTLVNGPIWTDSVLDYGGALSFDGIDDHVEIPHSDDLTFTASDSYTVTTWVNVTALPGHWAGIVDKSRDISPHYGLWIDASNQWVAGDVNIIGSTVTLGWHHLALVQDGSANTRTVYVDGTVDITGSAITANGAGDLWFGGAKSVTEYLEGVIDDVRIYNRALSAEDVLELIDWTGSSGANAGKDLGVYGGDRVTLSGSGPADATSFKWEQIAGTPTVTLEPSPNQAVVQFDAPELEIGTILTFRLTVDAPSTEGETTDTADVIVRAINAPKVAPGPFRVMPLDLGTAGLGYRVVWPPLFDAEQYDIGLDLGGTIYWLETIGVTTYDVKGLTPGAVRTIVIRGRNKHGSSDAPAAIATVSRVAMRNLARPASMGGTTEPSDHVYVISHYAITGMN